VNVNSIIFCRSKRRRRLFITPQSHGRWDNREINNQVLTMIDRRDASTGRTSLVCTYRVFKGGLRYLIARPVPRSICRGHSYFARQHRYALSRRLATMELHGSFTRRSRRGQRPRPREWQQHPYSGEHELTSIRPRPVLTLFTLPILEWTCTTGVPTVGTAFWGHGLRRARSLRWCSRTASKIASPPRGKRVARVSQVTRVAMLGVDQE